MDVQVNFYSLSVIFAVSLIVHLLISHITIIYETILKVTGLTKPASNEQEELTKEISALQREKSALHPTDDFVKCSRLQRQISEKQSILKDVVGQQKKSIRWNVKFPLYVTLRISMEMITLISVWHCYQQPVLTAPDNWFYPLDKLPYPFWSKGTVGSSLWMISCRLALRQFSNLGHL